MPSARAEVAELRVADVVREGGHVLEQAVDPVDVDREAENGHAHRIACLGVGVGQRLLHGGADGAVDRPDENEGDGPAGQTSLHERRVDPRDDSFERLLLVLGAVDASLCVLETLLEVVEVRLP